MNDLDTTIDDYAARGWRMLPLHPERRTPLLKDWPHLASSDPDVVRGWCQSADTNAIGIATGAASGIWVLDIDIKDGHHGDETLRNLIDTHGELPATHEVITGTGGMHLYYTWDDDHEVRNSAGKLGDGLDVRGEGGYVVAPPSINTGTGQAYTLEASAPEGTVAAPKWLLDLALEATRTRTPANIPANIPAPTSDRPGDIYNAATTWAQVLEPDGWTLSHVDRDGESHWTRPGKTPREGTSATTNYQGTDTLKVFTSGVPWLEAEQTYSRFAYYTARHHQGDFSGAGRALAATQRTSEPRLEDLIAKLPEAQEVPWEDPEPLITTPPVPGFPLDALPDWAVAHAQDVAEAIQVPVDLPATFAIGSLAAALTGHATLDISPRWNEPTNLYLAVVMRSGAGKSPAEKMMAGWLRRWEAAAIAEAAPERDKAVMIAKNARRRADEAEKGAVLGSTTDDEAWQKRVDAATAAEEIPALPRLLIDDATPEAVAGALAAYDEHLAIMSTEADLFDMALGDGHRKPNINVYLKAWSGDSLIRDRKGSTESGPEMTKLERPLLTVCCAAQPRVLDRISTDAELVGRGFVQRFMLAVPEHDFGDRDYSHRFASSAMPHQHTYEATATACAIAWADYGPGTRLALADDAKRALARFMAEVEPELADGQRLAPIAEWMSKCFASVARWAGVLHLAERRPPGEYITADTMERSIRLGWYWIGHSLAAHVQAGDEVHIQARAILDKLREKELCEFTANELQRALRRPGIGLDKAVDYVPALRLLVDNHWIRPVDGDGWSDAVGSGRKSPRFAANTKVHEMDFESHLARVARGALYGERENSLPIDTPPSREPRATRYTRQSEPTQSAPLPVDNSPVGWQPGDDPFAPLDAGPLEVGR